MTDRKICIIGFAETTRDDAPVKDDSWEFWGCNYLPLYFKAPWSRMFEMHGRSDLLKAFEEHEGYRDWLEKATCPIYMLSPIESIPMSRRYPLEEVDSFLERLGTPRGYYCSTIAFALAMAICENPEEIALYGVDMIIDSEWGYQRPNCEYLIGLARGLGIKVTTPTGCALLRAEWTYGYQDRPPYSPDALVDALSERAADLDVEVKRLKKEWEDAGGRYLVHYGAYQESLKWKERLQAVKRGLKL